MSRTPALPPGWTRTTLAMFKWGSGGTPRRSDSSNYGGGIPWAVIGDLKDGMVTRTTATITQKGLAGSSARWVEPGSVLVAMYGSIGKLGLAGVRMTTNQAIAFTKAEGVLPKYLFWYLAASREELAFRGKGGTQKNISQEVLKAFPFVLAPAAEQRRIVAEIEKQFTRLDAGVEALKRLQAHLRRYRAAVLKAACEGSLEGFNSDKWNRVRVADIAEVKLGRQRSPANRPGKYARPYLRAGNVTWAGLDVSDVKEMDFTPAEFGRYVLRRGDVLLSEASGSASEVGKPVVYRGEIPNCCFQNTLIRVRARDAVPEYLRYRFLHDAWSGRFATASKGVGIYHLGAARLSALELLLPPLAEQRRLVEALDERFSVCEAQEASAETGLQRASRLKTSLLAAAFDGRLTP